MNRVHREQSAREAAQRQAAHPIPITYTRAVSIPPLRELVFEWEAVRHDMPISTAKRLHMENCTDELCAYVATLIARGYDVGWDSAGGR
jgi:hypothetical protein